MTRYYHCSRCDVGGQGAGPCWSCGKADCLARQLATMAPDGGAHRCEADRS